MRLFIAINFDGKTKAGIGKAIEGLKPYAIKGRFTHMDNLHLTLVFIGETIKLSQVKEAMDELAAPPFPLIIQGFGRFCRPGGDICWLGVSENDVMANVHAQLSASLSQQGFVLERRPFKPHLTLGRELVFKEEFNPREFQQTIEPMQMEVTKVSLMQSERIAGRLKYTEIYKRWLSDEEAEN
ncbi:MAG: RNA 2',3'-cyclic phosphodiesterase [Eubacteriales bacterium]|nr:RNA 2',3'-cyclic phosphodiesterase [Eubacteriales bacterium]MDD3074564.1 RNA 2',3'-cyclic phosphodiesterase [Eubacteriales bacterium]MDD4078210.1 RNA 2',3'-cyclic phosphodiesterase [Eubacteriales bacterium]MDD4769239.1 RNA 2',3'-cyclic phosphodiesterase [Eubacteriales bacterium]